MAYHGSSSNDNGEPFVTFYTRLWGFAVTSDVISCPEDIDTEVSDMLDFSKLMIYVNAWEDFFSISCISVQWVSKCTSDLL